LKLTNAVVTGDEDDYIAMIQEPKSQEEIDAELAEEAPDVSTVEEVKKEGEDAEAPAEGGEAAPAAEEKKE
jgi:hypothetical protein